ncbi:MAG: hypothetical protein ABI947_08725 [Chloroflexota bacterium]
MIQQNPFDDDWRDCLCAHYIYVLHEQDTNNEESLGEVLIATGFTESDIVSLRVQTLGAEAAYAYNGSDSERVLAEDEISPEIPASSDVIEVVDMIDMPEMAFTESTVEAVASEPVSLAEISEPESIEPPIEPAPLPAKGKKKTNPPQQMSLF